MTNTTTQPSIDNDVVEEKYDEEFSGLVYYFVRLIEMYDFTDDEFHEALTEALNTPKENHY